MNQTADAVIVGGGVIGTSIAYHLAQRQLGRIVLIEKDWLASGSTGRSVATIDTITLHEPSVELYAYSASFFQNCQEILGSDCGFVRTGSLFLGGPQHEQSFRSAVQNMKDRDLPIRVISTKEIGDIDTKIILDEITTAIYAPNAGYADPYLTTNNLAMAAKKLGVAIDQGRKVTKIIASAGKIIGLETTTGSISTPNIIIAAGPWSKAILNALKISLPLQIVRHPVVSLQRPKELVPSPVALLDLTMGIYARPEGDELTLAGSLDPQVGHEAINQPEEGSGFVHEKYMIWVLERLIRRYPDYHQAQIRKGWSGLMTLSPDWQPVIGQQNEVQGLFYVAGLSGLGFQISPAIGEFLSALIAGEVWAAKILAPFSPERFRSGHPLPTYRSTFSK